MIQYTDGCGYHLYFRYSAQTGIVLPQAVLIGNVSLIQGVLEIQAGYGWDGPSGMPVKGRPKWMMRASLEHDALYELLRAGLLSQELREQIDQRFRTVGYESLATLNWVERTLYRPAVPAAYLLIRKFGEKYARRGNPRIYTAP